MKTARICLSFPVVGLCLTAAWTGVVPALGDTTDDAQNNPYMQRDPDGNPVKVAKTDDQPSEEELAAASKQEELDRNWLLRSYEKLQAHADSSADPNANLIYALGSNKELAELAGLSDLGLSDQETTPDLQANAAPGTELHPGTPPTIRGNAPTGGSLLRPLITPLVSPESGGLSSFYSRPPIAMSMPFAGDRAPVNLPAPAKASGAYQPSLAIETPGMVASGDSATDLPSDLSLDLPARESNAQERQDNNTKLELPLPMNAEQLHKTETAQLHPSGPLRATPVDLPVVKPVVLPMTDDDVPIPVTKLQPISPVHPAIANPYDILNR